MVIEALNGRDVGRRGPGGREPVSDALGAP
jgi:hypothetical protein